MPVMRVVPPCFCDGDKVVAVLLYNGFQLLLFIAHATSPSSWIFQLLTNYLKTRKPPYYDIFLNNVFLIVPWGETAFLCPVLNAEPFKCSLGRILGPNLVSNTKCKAIYKKALNPVKPNRNGAIPQKFLCISSCSFLFFPLSEVLVIECSYYIHQFCPIHLLGKHCTVHGKGQHL